jgi:predicted nucleic-acid-binding protein
MTGIDTNILIRHILQDDSIQSPKATRIVEHRLTPNAPGFISLATMLEMAWVLENTYKFLRPELVKAIEYILLIDTFVIQNEKEVFTAMLAVKTGKGEFADALIGALCAWAGCTSTLTFDRKAASRLPGFELL